MARTARHGVSFAHRVLAGIALLIAGAGEAQAQAVPVDEREVAACAVPGAPGVPTDTTSQPPSRAQIATGPQKKTLGPSVIGVRARAGWFNDAVAIDMGEGKQCTGVMVAADAVLTAGHCVCDGNLDDPTPRATPPKIVLGTSMKQARGSDTYALDLNLTTLYDPSFCRGYRAIGGTYMHGNDLALLFLQAEDAKALLPDVPPQGDGTETNTRFQVMAGRGFLGPTRSALVYPATPATPQLYLSSSLRGMIAVGYGLGRDPGTRDPLKSGEKRLSCVDIRSRICGFPEDRQRYGCAAGREFVLADPVADRDTCSGDSGGPVYAAVKRGNTYFYYLTGITSRGISRDDCGPGGVYSLITPRVVEWMRSRGVTVPNYESPDQ